MDMKTSKTWLVVFSSTDSPVYLGELDRGVRQGVTALRFAVRFTEIGATRVAAQYPGATVVNAESVKRVREAVLPAYTAERARQAWIEVMIEGPAAEKQAAVDFVLGTLPVAS